MSATGVSSPNSSASQRLLTLSYGSVEHVVLVPSTLLASSTNLRDHFQAALEKRDPLPEIETPVELVANFLEYLTEQNENQDAIEVLPSVLTEFQKSFLVGNDVHTIASSSSEPGVVVRGYLRALEVLQCPLKSSSPSSAPSSALLRAVDEKHAKIHAIFGGQGNSEDFFDELRSLVNIYGPLVRPLINDIAAVFQELLDSTVDARKVYTDGLEVLEWLDKPETTPSKDYLITAPVSVPLIGLIQLAHYQVTCKILGFTPGEFRHYLSGATGHSQGIVTALAISRADSWSDWQKETRRCATTLFYVGYRSQLSFPVTALSPTVLRDSEDHGEGVPSPMLAVRELSLEQLQHFVDQTNKFLSPEKQVSVSLVNGPRSFVVSGPPMSLYGLNRLLRNVKADPDANEGRIPYSERKLKIVNRFLRVTVPFHCSLLKDATTAVVEDMEAHGPATEMAIPVFDTYNGSVLDNKDAERRSVELINELPVMWEAATSFKGTHIIEFGPGGSAGLALLTLRNKEGTGERVIAAGEFSVPAATGLGSKGELFDRNDSSVKYSADWDREFSPKLVKWGGKLLVDTKFSRLLARPPLMVAGMTPCTTHPSVVAATLNSGYHIELAGGGYFSEPQLKAALAEVQKLTPAGITLNVLYVNPLMLQWCIPMVGEMRRLGFPIDGLTIGAGVPSIEVANEYIRDLGLKHISFKPGTVESIRQCVSIAAANPNFPVIIQWTGGRGGGHHSYEDFHAPILQTYGAIRKYSNIILVAGSGFGDAEGTYPYLTGEWSRQFSYPPMPFDGFLFGSRVMVASEFLTSEDAKKAIVAAAGVPDSKWEETYKARGGGGVITVTSEMGEQIHKLTTRGVMLWKELDTTIFSIPRGPKRVAALQARKEKLAKRLNADFQKPWFPTLEDGKVVDLEDMTYAQILRRLIRTMYVSSEDRWIDNSLRDMAAKFISRVEERLARVERQSVLQTVQQLDKPHEFIKSFVSAYPDSETQVLSAHDRDFFLELCFEKNHKPVPFVPALDENFEYWFKKDSLWQSEDLAAVDNDVGRTCILHGPVAAQFSKVADEPVGKILGSIHEGHIERLLKEKYNNDASNVPEIECLSLPVPHCSDVEYHFSGVKADKKDGQEVYTIGAVSTLPSLYEWLNTIAGSTQSWRYALIHSAQVEQIKASGSSHIDNPVRRVLAPTANVKVVATPTSMVLFEDGVKTFEAICNDNVNIRVLLWENRSASGHPEALELLFTYHPALLGHLPIEENMEGRNLRIKQFYWRMWFGDDKYDPPSLEDEWTDRSIVVDGKLVKDFAHAVGNKGEAHVHGDVAPMDFAIVIGWRAITKGIFPNEIDGDLLKLVHLSNRFSMVPGAQPIKKGQEVYAKASIAKVVITPAGKVVDVRGTIYTGDKPVITVSSQFLYRGSFNDYDLTFEKIDETPVQLKMETPKDVAILFSKEWFHPSESITPESLVGKTLVVRCKSYLRFKTANVFEKVNTTGVVEYILPTRQVVEVGEVVYESGQSLGNPVVDFLNRKGVKIEQPVHFEAPIAIAGVGEALKARSPATNELYAQVSADYNPIHVSRVFSSYVDLPGTITHGMYTSALVRSQVEMWAANNDGKRVRAFSSDFVGMVLPNSELHTSLEHIGMINGRKIINVRTSNSNGDLVLQGTAEVEQPITTYVFTGQGSQEQGMGMDLYSSSDVAREVWDRADRHFVATYGISILDIVRNNPRTLTVHFGGETGRTIRENYMSMMFETLDENGQLKVEPIFPTITDATDHYTYTSPNGVLSMTQFTQPALTLMEKAAFEDMKAKGFVDLETSAFAGHSLGEYSALAAMAEVMPVESLVDVVFYRGMTMQVAVPRDSSGRSNYGMCAVNPSRVHLNFSENDLRTVVSNVSKETGWLLEIVNFNVANQQYVTAGDLRALDTLNTVLNLLKKHKVKTLSVVSEEDGKTFIAEAAKIASAKPQPITLERGIAVIPLPGISVPFHSSYLRSGVKPFKNFLSKRISKDAIEPSSLEGKYIPNLTAQPFKVSKEYFQTVYDLTGSPECKRVIDNWDEITKE
ncbi:tetrafunctional fatty acid synthase subunit [Starmerella bacillaris]|uniref:Fatty acid synthase subunit beta n=1 Tax=Starmerella bacillaris TaxID=1247836 RepID=A0AAV5RFY4_STABA|nr:tetrafunctional fatty acid synthase subunit [Starmerella bacillaris]